MIAYQWPSWHAHHELKAVDLLGLEDYLLARVLIVDEVAYGVDYFDWKQSLDDQVSDSEITLRVHALRGTTPIGQAVWLRSVKPDQPTGRLEARLATPLPEDFYFDLWIVVNDANEEADKLTLLAETVLPSAEPIIPGKDDKYNRLYLGRYLRAQRAEGGQLELIHRPMPRRLGGFGPVADDAWQRWVRPLSARLEELWRDVSARKGYDAASLTVAAELLRLSFEWPALPIPILVRRLRMVHWLWERSNNPDLAPDPVDSVKPLEHYFTWTGDALPEKLGAMLPHSGARSDGFAQSVTRLLEELLAQGGVGYHAPLTSLRAWVEQIESGAVRSSSAEETTALDHQLEEALAGHSNRGGHDAWSQAVAFITLLNIRTNANSDAERGSEPYSRTGLSDLRKNAANELEELYKVARQVPAGPLAFYWLARAAENQLEIAKWSSVDVQDYFRHLEGAAELAPRKSSGTGHTKALVGDGVDRVAAFLSRANTRASVATQVRPYLWSPKELACRDRRAPLGAVRITIVGGPQSGKTTLIRELIRGCRESAVPSGLQFEPSGDTNAIDAGEPKGSLLLDGRAIDVHLVDGGSVLGHSPPLDEPTRDSERYTPWDAASLSDLLVVAIEPATIDRPPLPDESTGLRDVALWTLRRRPNALVAIAYTKADEYGVVEPQVLRFVNDESEAAKLRALRSAVDVEKAWKLFAEGNVATARQEVRYGEVIFSGTRSKGQGGEWVKTREKILEQTRQLWEALARRSPVALLNGYFISANPRDPYLEPWSNRGVLQLVVDFVECLRGGT